ncbi:MAG: hypothetical protein MJZ65_00375 [Paludibacteraceae bacterium]|nr:hypothetical protein [Paludibacteraceae bacterium]
MKKFAFALMAIATLAMVACDKKDEPKNNGEGGGEQGGDDFVSMISVRDKSIDDWNALPASYVATATTAANPDLTGLKSVKVFADEVYINVLIQYDPTVILSKSWDNALHMYFDADNSDATGGYGDEFADPNAEWCLETSCWAEGVAQDYNPAVFKWWGEVGESGWLWTDPENPGTEENGWGAIVPTGSLPIGQSQMIGTDMIEIQLLRELIPAQWNDKTFGVGFDIQDAWETAGILPNADVDELGNRVTANKLKVNIYYAE